METNTPNDLSGADQLLRDFDPRDVLEAIASIMHSQTSAPRTPKYEGSEFGFTSVDFDPAEAARWEVGRNRGGEI